MKLNCIIIEDVEIEAEMISTFINKIDFLKLNGNFTTALSAQSFLHQHPDTNLIFSDINLPDVNGLNFFKALQNPPQVIFTTHHRDFAADSYDIGTTDYIVKPIKFERLLAAANKAYQKHIAVNRPESEWHGISAPEKDHFFIRSNFAHINISFNEILFIESVKDYIKIVTEKGSHLTYLTLKGILNSLPGNQFIRIHRSFVVNIKKINSLKNEEVNIGKYHLTIGENYRKGIKEMIENNSIRR